jgi:hypothetical protein
MPSKATVKARLKELVERGEAIQKTGRTTGGHAGGRVYTMPSSTVSGDAHQWAMSVMAILKSAFGESNENYQQVKNNLSHASSGGNFFLILSALKAAQEDFEGGYFFEQRALLEADVFHSLLEQAEELERSGYYQAAIVLCGAVLEQQMRTVCTRNGITPQKTNGKHMMINEMNDALAKTGAYNLHKKKLITAWADLRNQAAHGAASSFKKEDVQDLLRDVTRFCADFA